MKRVAVVGATTTKWDMEAREVTSMCEKQTKEVKVGGIDNS